MVYVNVKVRDNPAEFSCCKNKRGLLVCPFFFFVVTGKVDKR